MQPKQRSPRRGSELFVWHAHGNRSSRLSLLLLLATLAASTVLLQEYAWKWAPSHGQAGGQQRGAGPARRQLREAPAAAAQQQALQQPGGLLEVVQELLAPAQTHGWVAKAGPVDLLQWHPRFEKERVAQFKAWSGRWQAQLGQQASLSTQELLEPPLFNPAGCQVWVSHRYKYIYVRHPKTGSASLLNYLTRCDMEKRYGPAGPACAQRLSDLDLPPQEVARLFSDYFVFTVVRNPHLRALSAYKFLVAKFRTEPANCTTAAPVANWDGFCADPMRLGLRCQQRPECCAFPPAYFWQHVSSQARCLLAAPAGAQGPGAAAGRTGRAGSMPLWGVDYVARTERLSEDLEEVIAAIDARRPAGVPALRSVLGAGGLQRGNASPACAEGGGRLEPHNMTLPSGQTYLAAVHSEQYCREEEYFGGQHSGCLEGVRRFFRDDLDLLYSSGTS